MLFFCVLFAIFPVVVLQPNQKAGVQKKKNKPNEVLDQLKFHRACSKTYLQLNAREISIGENNEWWIEAGENPLGALCFAFAWEAKERVRVETQELHFAF